MDVVEGSLVFVVRDDVEEVYYDECEFCGDVGVGENEFEFVLV